MTANSAASVRDLTAELAQLEDTMRGIDAFEPLGDARPRCPRAGRPAVPENQIIDELRRRRTQ